MLSLDLIILLDKKNKKNKNSLRMTTKIGHVRNLHVGVAINDPNPLIHPL